LQHRVINAREIAAARGLVFLRAQSERVHIDTAVRGAGVVLVGLHHVEVGALTLREAVLAVKLELRRDARVLTPAVHVEGGLRKHEGASVGHQRGRVVSTLGKGGKGGARGSPVTRSGSDRGGAARSGGRNGVSTRQVKETRRGDERVSTSGGRLGAERVDRVGERINRVRVVEGLSTQGVEEDSVGRQRGAVVDVGVGLHNPDQLLAGVVEVQLDLVARASDRLIAGKLHLLEEVLMGVLSHLAALVSVEEHIVDVQRCRHQGLLVGEGRRHGGAGDTRQGGDSPEALAHRADIEVDLNFVVLYTTLYPSFRNI